MDAAPPMEPVDWKHILTHPRTVKALLAGLVVGGLCAAGGWWFWLKPQRAVARMRYETMQDVSTLFGLQLHYFKVKGVYAPDLDTLLALSPDRDEFKARMAGHLDMSTLAVVGDAERFKVEANVLDKDRTLIKIKGPIETPKRVAPVLPPLAAPRVDADGAPIAPGR